MKIINKLKKDFLFPRISPNNNETTRTKNKTALKYINGKIDNRNNSK